MRNAPYPLYEAELKKNIKEFVSYCAKKYSTRLAFAGDTIGKTYEEFETEARYIGTKLINDIGINNKIALVGENSYEWILTYISVVCSGNIIVPIDKDLPEESINNILSETKCCLIFCSDKCKDIGCDIKKINMQQDLQNYITSGEELYKNNHSIYDGVKIDDEDVATIIYTSGTTGIAKGVMLTHKNLCTNIYISSKNLLITGNSLLVLPLHHTFAFMANVLCMLNIGHTTHISKSLKRVSKELMEYKPKVMFIVPMIVETFYKKIWNTAKETKKDKLLRALIKISNILRNIGIDIRRKIFKSVLKSFGGELELIVCGGALLDNKYIKAFDDLGITLLNGYGITECSPIVSVNRNKYIKENSVGLILEGLDIKIDNKDGQREGEILVKGDIVMKGYFNNDEKTKEVMTDDGYFRTGDIGYLDEDKFLYITGRCKNIIILDNGKNVYPEELELVLSNEEAISEVIVYGKENKITAEIYPDKEYIEGENITDVQEYFNGIIESFNKSQPMYKQINDIVLRDCEFEKTTTKKIKRKY